MVRSSTTVSVATPQLRNVATLGGNLLQRPRCWYYRNALFHCSLKGGDTRQARDGENQLHAIFDESCHKSIVAFASSYGLPDPTDPAEQVFDLLAASA